jgi:hypothetical protein
MSIKDLNTVALVTPKSRIEQAVGRIFRLKKEERIFAPVIYDIRDMHDVLQGQYRKRVQFYEQCGYQIVVKRMGDSEYRPVRSKRATECDENTIQHIAAPLFRAREAKK